jgi:hypothetical protein
MVIVHGTIKILYVLNGNPNVRGGKNYLKENVMEDILKAREERFKLCRELEEI